MKWQSSMIIECFGTQTEEIGRDKIIMSKFKTSTITAAKNVEPKPKLTQNSNGRNLFGLV